jgi:hypothetical protein
VLRDFLSVSESLRRAVTRLLMREHQGAGSGISNVVVRALRVIDSITPTAKAH